MASPRIVVIGGGLAGLSAGCYARVNDFDVTVVEHNVALGGVCTAWQRGPYLVDGCIHWLTGGPFLQVYEELGIVPPVTLRPLEQFMTYRHAREGWEVAVRRNLDETRRELQALGPEDADELDRVMEGAEQVASMRQSVDRPPELTGMGDQLRGMWRMRHEIGALARFRKPIETWTEEHLKSPRVRKVFRRMAPPETPTFFLIMILGYLSRGWLSRPDGGTARFRDVLIDRYRALGGHAVLNTTVEEVLVADNRATGVRLTDGTMIEADVVVSTSSGPETVFRLLSGRYGAADWKERMDSWRMFQPIVLASYGVAHPFDRQPSTLVFDEIDPLMIGDFPNDHLVLRIYNEDPVFAPAGHTVVQAMLSTGYDWWATRGAQYQHEKEVTGDRVVECIERCLPGVKEAVQMVDLATPLTFWRSARSWRGAFEGWMPGYNVFKHVPKSLPGLERFYMAGQWVEPGGGVPVATMSGRHVIEIICAALQRPFAPTLVAAGQVSR